MADHMAPGEVGDYGIDGEHKFDGGAARLDDAEAAGHALDADPEEGVYGEGEQQEGENGDEEYAGEEEYAEYEMGDMDVTMTQGSQEPAQETY
ncbi:hypothetical protein H4R19_007193, partial [Coemansia spiralis]